DSVILRSGLWRSSDDERTLVGTKQHRKDRNVMTRRDQLILHRLIAWPKRLEPISCSDIGAAHNRSPFRYVLESCRINWPIECNMNFGRAHRICQDRLRQFALGVGDF